MNNAVQKKNKKTVDTQERPPHRSHLPVNSTLYKVQLMLLKHTYSFNEIISVFCCAVMSFSTCKSFCFAAIRKKLQVSYAEFRKARRYLETDKRSQKRFFFMLLCPKKDFSRLAFLSLFKILIWCIPANQSLPILPVISPSPH